MRPDYVYVFDECHRVYPPLTAEQKAAGKLWSGGPPIYREFWRKEKIVGETSRSWITDRDHKIPKKGTGKHFLRTDLELDQRCWLEEHRHKLRNLLDWGPARDNAEAFDALAAAIGYAPRMPR